MMVFFQDDRTGIIEDVEPAYLRIRYALDLEGLGKACVQPYECEEIYETFGGKRMQALKC